MAYSKIGICNLALAHLGADSIRSFDEKNKRARMCDVFYEAARDYLLSRFDWPFARTFIELQPLDLDESEQIPGLYAYQLPSDCKTPRDIYPPGSKDPWNIQGRTLWCKKAPTTDGGPGVKLYYTLSGPSVAIFSDPFATTLALLLAVRMGPVITGNNALVATLNSQYEIEMLNSWESEANIGNDYRSYNETPDNDSFVWPDGHLIDDDSTPQAQ